MAAAWTLLNLQGITCITSPAATIPKLDDFPDPLLLTTTLAASTPLGPFAPLAINWFAVLVAAPGVAGADCRNGAITAATMGAHDALGNCPLTLLGSTITSLRTLPPFLPCLENTSALRAAGVTVSCEARLRSKKEVVTTTLARLELNCDLRFS